MLLLTCVLASTVVGMAANSWSEQSTVIFESRQIHWHFLGQLEMLVTASKARKMASKAKKCLLYWPPCSHRGLLTIIPMAASTGDSTGCAIHKWQISGKNSNTHNFFPDLHNNQSTFLKSYGLKTVWFWLREIRQSTIYYAGLLGQWNKWIVDQESDVPSIIFFYPF